MSSLTDKLLDEYRRVNNIRHGMYVKRCRYIDKVLKIEDVMSLSHPEKWTAIVSVSNRARKEWNAKYGKKLEKAKRDKKKASKKLRTHLKKEGLCIVWGANNQVKKIEPISQRKERLFNKKAIRLKWKTVDIVEKLDLLHG